MLSVIVVCVILSTIWALMMRPFVKRAYELVESEEKPLDILVAGVFVAIMLGPMFQSLLALAITLGILNCDSVFVGSAFYLDTNLCKLLEQ